VNLREVDEHGHAGAAVADGLLQLAELAPDARQVADDLGQPHDGHLFGADDALQAAAAAMRGPPMPKKRAARLAGGGKSCF
jgi:hypothetical protein